MKHIVLLSALLIAMCASAKDIYTAIAIVESNNNPSAVGDNGKAIGIYQIHKIYVDDVNRIIKEKKYTYKDRKDTQKSLEMVKIYTDFYGKRYTKITGKKVTPEIIARIHNGGLNGWKKSATLKYWHRVKKEMEK